MKVTISKGPARCGKLDDRHHSGRKWLVAGRRLPRRVWASASGVIAALLVSSGGLKAVTVTTLGGSSAGYVNGPTLSTALFHTPAGLALNSSASLLYVADRDNNVVRRLDLAAAITYTFVTNQINRPVGVALDASGKVYVLNRSFNGTNGSVRVFDSFGNMLAAFPPSGGVLTNVNGNRVVLTNANGFALDGAANMSLTVSNNTVIQIAHSGGVATIKHVNSTNTMLQGITIMDSGLLAVCDSGRNGILFIDPANGLISTNTGFNGAGDTFGGKVFAQFNGPTGIAKAGASALVVTDNGNNRVKVVDAFGTVTNLYGVNSSYWTTPYPGWGDGDVCPGGAPNYNCFGYAESRLAAGVFVAQDTALLTSEDFFYRSRRIDRTRPTLRVCGVAGASPQ